MGKVDSGASSGAEGWKDVLQLLKEQNEKMERSARAISVIQQGMLRNNPGFVKDSVNEAIEVLSGMLNTHKCLLESRRPRSASLGYTPKKLKKGEKRVAPSPPKDWIPKKGKGNTSPTYAMNRAGRPLMYWVSP